MHAPVFSDAGHLLLGAPATKKPLNLSGEIQLLREATLLILPDEETGVEEIDKGPIESNQKVGSVILIVNIARIANAVQCHN